MGKLSKEEAARFGNVGALDEWFKEADNAI